jgi:hypothetical protein
VPCGIRKRSDASRRGRLGGQMHFFGVIYSRGEMSTASIRRAEVEDGGRDEGGVNEAGRRGTSCSRCLGKTFKHVLKQEIAFRFVNVRRKGARQPLVKRILNDQPHLCSGLCPLTPVQYERGLNPLQ